MKEIFFFSSNKNKIKEINNIFKNFSIKISNLENFKIKFPEETGYTFNQNAKIKSLYGYSKFKKPCFADDSGICIEAMNWGPAVNSKKFIESKKNINICLKEIISTASKEKKFNAYFQTTICLSINKNEHYFFTGKVKGKISKEIRGGIGFGYDPIFIPSNHKLTYAEMTIEEKNLISHRALAIEKLKKYIFSSI